MNSVEQLIVSSTIDYSTDLICYGLKQRGKRYLRVNRDRFGEYKIGYDLSQDILQVEMDGDIYQIEPGTLKSIYFRAPVFLRTDKAYSLERQLYRSQWSSFIRNLIILDGAKWINHPVATYRAENKLYQLKCAKRLGLNVPKTYVGNSAPENISLTSPYIVKPLDTALFYEDGDELFTYSTMVTGQELLDYELKSAPIVLQECLQNKVDLRVTIVGERVFPVSITTEGAGIEGDWRRLEKERLRYTPVSIPDKVTEQLLALMRLLRLEFGGIDLAILDDTYYFIEVNPTGEWGWLTSTAHLPIDSAIVDALVEEG